MSGKSLGVDRTGELYVRGPQVMLGYIKDPEATALTIDGGGWMRTGEHLTLKYVPCTLRMLWQYLDKAIWKMKMNVSWDILKLKSIRHGL